MLQRCWDSLFLSFLLLFYFYFLFVTVYQVGERCAAKVACFGVDYGCKQLNDLTCRLFPPWRADLYLINHHLIRLRRQSIKNKVSIFIFVFIFCGLWTHLQLLGAGPSLKMILLIHAKLGSHRLRPNPDHVNVSEH